MADSFLEMFGDWGIGRDGQPKPLTVEPFRGQNATGAVYGDKISRPGLPQFGQERLVRNSEGNEATSTAAVYAPMDLRGDFPLRSRVTLADGRVTAVLSVAVNEDADDFSFMVVNVE